MNTSASMRLHGNARQKETVSGSGSRFQIGGSAMKKRFAFLTASVLACTSLFPSAMQIPNITVNAADSVNIMAIGDSITFGLGEDGGYRKYLDYALKEKGISFDMVGPEGKIRRASITMDNPASMTTTTRATAAIPSSSSTPFQAGAKTVCSKCSRTRMPSRKHSRISFCSSSARTI